MLDLKYQAPPFCKLSPLELDRTATGLLIKIHVITGWNFPTQIEHQNILTNQFALLLVEKFPMVNHEEMEHAFRNYPMTDWGKNMNLSLIQEVMEPYLEKRHEISRIEEQVRTKKELPPPNEPEMSDDEFLEMNKSIWKGSRLFGLISVKCYSILTKRGLINLTPEQKTVILNKARANFFSPENKENRDGLIFNQHENYITMDAKKIACANYWENVL